MSLSAPIPAKVFEMPDWNVVPKECALNNKWNTLNTVALPIFALLATLGTIAIHHYKPESVYWIPVGILAVKSCLWTVAVLMAPFSVRFCRRAGGITMQNGGEMLPFSSINRTYSKQLANKLFVDADINKLVRKDLEGKTYLQFVNKHGFEIASHLDDENKKTLREKFLAQDFSDLPGLNKIKEYLWVKALKVPDDEIAKKLAENQKHLDYLGSTLCDWNQFSDQYGVGFLPYLPIHFKSNFSAKLTAFVIGQNCGTKRAVKEFGNLCKTNFGEQAFLDMKRDIIIAQMSRITYERASDYKTFRAENDWSDIQAIALKHQSYKNTLRTQFLKMTSDEQAKPEYAEDRAMLQIQL